LTPDIFGIVSAVVALVAYPPYLKSVLQQRTKPHVFSWVIWTLLTWIAFAIQVASGAGPGAWATGLTAFCTTIIAIVSLRHGEKNITRSDWATFIAGLLAIPLWILTKDPTASAILVTVIDCFGFYPTFRKSWHKPQEEFVITHFLSLIKHALSIFALTIVNIPTAFYPIALLIMNILLVAMIVWRRSRQSRSSLDA
jgi:chromate transport protein ChrA